MTCSHAFTAIKVGALVTVLSLSTSAQELSASSLVTSEVPASSAFYTSVIADAYGNKHSSADASSRSISALSFSDRVASAALADSADQSPSAAIASIRSTNYRYENDAEQSSGAYYENYEGQEDDDVVTFADITLDSSVEAVDAASALMADADAAELLAPSEQSEPVASLSNDVDAYTRNEKSADTHSRGGAAAAYKRARVVRTAFANGTMPMRATDSTSSTMHNAAAMTSLSSNASTLPGNPHAPQGFAGNTSASRGAVAAASAASAAAAGSAIAGGAGAGAVGVSPYGAARVGAALAAQVSAVGTASHRGTPASVSSQDENFEARNTVEHVSEDGRTVTSIFAPVGGVDVSDVDHPDVHKVLLSRTKISHNNGVDGEHAEGGIPFMGIEIVEAPDMEDTSLVAELHEAIAPLVGKNLSAPLLQEIGDTVTAFYQGKGYLGCQSYMPQQQVDMDNAVFNVSVLAAELKDVNVENTSTVRDSYVDYLLSGIVDGEGKVINHHDLYEKMLKLNDLGTFTLKGQFDSITPDNVVNNLDLMAAPAGDRAYFTLTADNFGSESQGRYRFGGNLEVINPTGSSDRLSLFYAHTDEDQADYSLGYTIPINSHPTLLGMSLCYSNAELGGLYRELGTKNEELTFEAFVREPIHRSLHSIANLQAGYIYRKMSTDFSAFELKTKKHSNAAYLQLSGSKDFDSNTLISSSLRVTAGKMENDDEYELALEDSFLKVNGSVAFNFVLNEHFSSSTSFDVQLSNTMLDGSEVMQVGGETGLLAYQASDLCGDSGIVASERLQYLPVTDIPLIVSPHFEVAKVYTHGFEDQRGASTGLSVMYSDHGLSAMVDYSHTVGDMPEYVMDSGRFNFKVNYTF